MIKKLSFTIPIAPVTKKNHPIVNTKTKKPIVLPSKQYMQYEKDCGKVLTNKGININYPVNVCAVYYMKTRRKCDLTNLNQALHDVLVKYGIVEDDNYTIIASTDGSRVDYDKDDPRTVVTITAKGEEDA